MRRGSWKLLVMVLISGTMFPVGCIGRHVEGKTTTYATEPWVLVRAIGPSEATLITVGNDNRLADLTLEGDAGGLRGALINSKRGNRKE
jgi:hypothetical protein